MLLISEYILWKECHRYIIHEKCKTPKQNWHCLEKIHTVLTIENVESVQVHCGIHKLPGTLMTV